MISGIENVKGWYNPGFFALIGLSIFGFGTAMVTIPVLPEILDAVEENEKLSKNMDEEKLYNHVSGYFVVC